MSINTSKLAELVDFGDNSDDVGLNTDSSCNREVEVVFWVLYSAVGTIILVGNSFTCIVLLASKRLRNIFMNIFLVSLSFWDVLMAIFVVPFYAIHCSHGCEYSLTKYCWIFRKAKDCVLLATTFNICAITYDRYLAVVRPLHYGAKMTKRRVTVILAGVWTAPVVVAGLRSTWHHTKTNEELRFANKLYDTILVIVFVIFSILVLMVANVKIMKAIKTQNERERTEQGRRAAWIATNKTITRRKGTRACILVVFVFILCWLPRIVYNLSYVIKPPGLASPLFLRLAFLSLYLQSSTNPFIYSFYRSEFRRAALKLLSWRNSANLSKVHPFVDLAKQVRLQTIQDLAVSSD
ncbi:tyramine receptor Ser-2-like [Stylophora pistillata]|uniref:tyramine receptor Ser-2-like n=1 Tax=Stylophora pistillata TaxID=50429 RepID=UPI000C052195|nr:tyramine receptor Ser-2-like [Stylophora pistillata]